MDPIWFLRKEDTVVYGPVSLTRMMEWAKAGRVGPQDYVSADQKQWMPAPELDELELNWMLDEGDGDEYGPVHIEACRVLVREGQIETGAILRNIRTGERKVLEKEPEAEPNRSEKRPEAEDETPGPADPPTWSIMARERDHSVDEARRWKALYEEERSTAAAAEAEASERIRDLEQDVIRLQAALEKSAMDVRGLEAVLERHGTEAGLDAGSLAKVYYEMSRRFEDLSKRYEVKRADVSRLSEEQDRLRREQAEQEEHSRVLLHRERAAADEARKRQAELEESYAESVRSLREINDRFIRARMGATSAQTSMSASRPTTKPGEERRTPEKPKADPAPLKPSAQRARGPSIRLT